MRNFVDMCYLSGKVNHKKWLEKRGLLPTQVKEKKSRLGKINTFPDLRIMENYPLGNKIDGACPKTDIMTNLHKETPEIQKAILDKANRTAPAYNKGGYQFITPGADLTDIGKKK